MEDDGEYCSHCGQKKIHPGDLTLRHAWHHVVHEAIHVDGKIFNTLRLLLTRPGQLTLDFFAGRRARHVHPIRLFLLIGVLFFLVAHVSAPIESPTALTPQTVNHIGPLRARVERAGKTPAEFAADLNGRALAALKPIHIGLLLFQGFSLWLLFRAQRPYLAEHMVTALHLSTFGMVVWIGFACLLIAGVPRSFTSNAWYLATMVYFLFAARRIYGGSWGVLLWRWVCSGLLTGLMLAATLIASVVLLVLTRY